MAYTPTNWVEGVTTLGPTNMNKIENELVALDARLGIPPVVNGTWLKGVGGAPVWTALGPADLPAMVGYGTTLPGSPVDGQEAILVDSTTNPTWAWRFRYNAGSSSAYKWEYIGGTPWNVEIPGPISLGTTGVWQNLSPFLMSVPRAGDYRFFANGNAYATGGASAFAASWYQGTTATLIGLAGYTASTAANVDASFAVAWFARTGVAASTQFGLAGHNAVATANWRFISHQIVPVRVA